VGREGHPLKRASGMNCESEGSFAALWMIYDESMAGGQDFFRS
jgi:hypothetical protein